MNSTQLMTINNNDGIILLSCPLHTLICPDSQLCSFINSPSAVINNGEVRQQNLHVPSLTIFVFFFLNHFSFQFCASLEWWAGESMDERGCKCTFLTYHTEQHLQHHRTVSSLVTLSLLHVSACFQEE